MKSNRASTRICIAAAIAVATLLAEPRPLHGQAWEIVRTIRPATSADPLRWDLLGPAPVGTAPPRYRLELQHVPPIGWKFSNLKLDLPRAAPETFPARIVGCGADGFPGAGVDRADLVLEIREASGPKPVLMVLANRDFYNHPCRLEASIASAPPGKSAIVFVGGWGASGFAAAAPTPVAIPHPGRTGLPAGSYSVQLARLATPASRAEVKYYTITLTNARVVDAGTPLSYPATVSGCPAPEADAEGERIVREGFSAHSEARPDGSLRVELVARAAPGCRIASSIPALRGR